MGPQITRPHSPVEISPFLSLENIGNVTRVTDLTSGWNTLVRQPGLDIIKALRQTRHSFETSEFLFSLAVRANQPIACDDHAATFEHLRAVPTSVMLEYLVLSDFWRRNGNTALADIVVDRRNVDTLIATSNLLIPEEPVTLFHSWKPGMVCVSRSFKFDELPSNPSDTSIWAVLSAAGWLEQDEVDIDELTQRALRPFVAIQNQYELKGLLSFCQQRGSLNVLVEIGTARGGLLYSLSQIASHDALIISIDLPGAPYGGGQTSSERNLFASFSKPEQQVHFISGDSKKLATREQLRTLLNSRPIDLLVIDGDHSYDGVRLDYLNYKMFMAPQGIIAFHDIEMYPEEWGTENAVGSFWKTVASNHHTIEIVDPSGICARDPGVKERSWGFGLVICAQNGAL